MLRTSLKSCRTRSRLIVALVAALLVQTAQAGRAMEGIELARWSQHDIVPRSRSTSGPLGAGDAASYRRIFALQEAGDWAAADILIGRIRDRILMGHVRFQRYMHPSAYRSSYQELERWLEQYADHPDADRAYRLARKRRPAGAGPLPSPVVGYLGGAGQELQERFRLPHPVARQRTEAEEAAVEGWRQRLEALLAQDDLDAASAALEEEVPATLLAPLEIDPLRWHIAGDYLARGAYGEAFRLARQAALRSGQQVPELHWLAGLSGWRAGRIDLAARHFAALAEAEGVHGPERARAAFWAARAHVVLRRPQYVERFLAIAAQGERDFYGLLARQVRGETPAYDWTGAKLGRDVLHALMREPGARRAMALGQIGQADLAEDEIRKLAARATPELMAGLIALADWLHLPAAQMRLAQSLGSAQGLYHHAALYPVPRWQPETGFTLDRALIYAIIRAESAFNPDAESHVGALGLMQVMPATAREIAKRAALELSDAAALRDPDTGIAIGQAYLEHLLNREYIGNNLMFLAAAYNAGPARVARWEDGLDAKGDPLLFLESIPFVETRAYVKKVLTNFWSYRARLGQNSPSLEALARNQWPTYETLDARPILHAQN